MKKHTAASATEATAGTMIGSPMPKTSKKAPSRGGATSPSAANVSLSPYNFARGIRSSASSRVGVRTHILGGDRKRDVSGHGIYVQLAHGCAWFIKKKTTNSNHSL